jgi:hypothetical protein
VTCTRRNRQGQEAEAWTLYASDALQRALQPYLARIQQEYMDIVEEEGRASLR